MPDIPTEETKDPGSRISILEDLVHILSDEVDTMHGALQNAFARIGALEEKVNAEH